MVLSLEKFKECISCVVEREEKEDILSDLLVSKDCNGFIRLDETQDRLFLELLQENMNDPDDYIGWWLYEAPANEKFVWETIDEMPDKKIVYNLNCINSLYYYLTKDFNKIPKDVIDSDEIEDIEQENHIAEISDILDILDDSSDN